MCIENKCETLVNYIRENFLKHYNQEAEVNTSPKAFIKFGSVHTSKINLSLGYYDIGAITEEISNFNSTISTNIVCSGRYVEGEDLINDGDKLFLQFAHPAFRFT